MQPTILHNPRLDGLDREKFEEMLASKSFGLLKSRIEGELERARVMCERADNGIEARRAQGAVAAFRAVLAMPAQIVNEMKAK